MCSQHIAEGIKLLKQIIIASCVRKEVVVSSEILVILDRYENILYVFINIVIFLIIWFCDSILYYYLFIIVKQLTYVVAAVTAFVTVMNRIYGKILWNLLLIV